MFVEQPVCHEPISVLINIYAPGLVLVEQSVGSNTNNAIYIRRRFVRVDILLVYRYEMPHCL